MRKVVLEATSEDHLRSLSGTLATAGIQFKLWTEQPENVITALATRPYPRSAVAPFFRKLRLLK